MFQIYSNPSGTAIGVVMSQEGRPVAYFTKKLNDTKRKFYVYNQEFYAIVQALKKWRYYFLLNDFFFILIIKLCNILIVKEN